MESTLKPNHQSAGLVSEWKVDRYDSLVLGYDEGYFKTLSGTPAYAGGIISILADAIIGKKSYQYGELSMLLNAPAPAAGVGNFFGLSTATQSTADGLFGIVTTNLLVYAYTANHLGTPYFRDITTEATPFLNQYTNWKFVWTADYVEVWANTTKLAHIATSPDSSLPIIPSNALAVSVQETGGAAASIRLKSFEMGYMGGVDDKTENPSNPSASTNVKIQDGDGSLLADVVQEGVAKPNPINGLVQGVIAQRTSSLPALGDGQTAVPRTDLKARLYAVTEPNDYFIEGQTVPVAPNLTPIGATFRSALTSVNNGEGIGLQSDEVGRVRITTSDDDILRYTDLAANVSASIKATPGRVYSLVCTNKNAATRYIQLHNKAAIPVNPEAPIAVFPVPANSTVIIGKDVFTDRGMEFSIGVAVGFSTTDTTYTAGAAADQITQIRYA